jgi:predicted ArsR family transcriptional regulator
MKSTRNLLLDYLEAHRVATATELSRALKVTAADVRHHLKLLIVECVVETIGHRQPTGRGRPARLFRLSQQTLGENLGILASALLNEALNETSGHDQTEYLQRIAKKLSGVGSLHGNLTRRLYQATQRLNILNYQARWEAHTDAPQVIFEHCPYAAIVEEHPELCRLDELILENLIAIPVTQVAKLVQDARGAPYCKFRVNSGETYSV